MFERQKPEYYVVELPSDKTSVDIPSSAGSLYTSDDKTYFVVTDIKDIPQGWNYRREKLVEIAK
jgi:hypothetical protein